MNLKVLRIDKGREYLPEQFKRICEDKGIIRHLTIPYTPQQNGVAERRNRTLLEMARSMMAQAKSSNILLGRCNFDYCAKRCARWKANPLRVLLDIDEPATYEEIVTSPNANEWITAMKDEMSSMAKNNVWELVDLPTGHKTIGNKWVLKVKRKADGSIDKFKARLVAKGYTQKEGRDYEETFSLVVRFASVRLILAIVAHLDLELFQMDVKTTFLNGELDEEIYMDQPEGNNMEMIVATQKWLSSTFEMKDMGEAEYILGVKIHRDRSKKLLSLFQETYIKRIIERFHMHNVNPIDTPMDKSCVLSKEFCPITEEEKKRMTKIPYASAVGSLMYAMMCTRLDLCFAVGMVSRYQSNPGPDHWVAVKRILRYLKGTSNLALCYHGGSLRLVGYSDVIMNC
ncbi:Retrovirus-related Pol polyprotein from transposon TNT 1-94 [Sesamum angolense]|uniref:Retrovirus-related Pol polyprotein from transposon TNT 1-94 n=1 Tax=Sesamum angolense TaxID=2727404 RepID=A0AAE2C2H3_9LAMI|nr:Retrovirus-related Pol polyprotein from transposon TNT 1-94 [Sesamum angolense]